VWRGSMIPRDHMLVFQQERHVLEREREGSFRFADRDLPLRALLGMVNHTAQWFRPRGRLSTEQIARVFVELLGSRWFLTPAPLDSPCAGCSDRSLFWREPGTVIRN